MARGASAAEATEVGNAAARREARRQKVAGKAVPRMEERGAVSLWFVEAPSRPAFESWLEISYTEDGDSLGSAFGRAFGMGRYDDDFQEACFSGRRARTLRAMLRGCSYDDVVIPRFEALGCAPHSEENAFVLLYNFRYAGRAKTRTTGPVRCRFAAVSSYV
jgi:hypothetical protein